MKNLTKDNLILKSENTIFRDKIKEFEKTILKQLEQISIMTDKLKLY